MNLQPNEDSPTLNVSRETLERLRCFESLVKKWSPKINLVSKSNLAEIWSRHIINSIQVYGLGGRSGHWVDLGSGGGFPGIVVGILADVERPKLQITLVESDQRKCAFLRTAIRETGIDCMVLSDRAEAVEPLDADILSARALTKLSGLLEFADRHLSKDGLALFPKGVTWQKEVDEARRSWRFDLESIPSETEPGAVILKIRGASRV